MKETNYAFLGLAISREQYIRDNPEEFRHTYWCYRGNSVYNIFRRMRKDANLDYIRKDYIIVTNNIWRPEVVFDNKAGKTLDPYGVAEIEMPYRTYKEWVRDTEFREEVPLSEFIKVARRG